MFKNTITLIAGTTIAKVMALIAIPLIARIYGPEIVGQYSLFVAVIAVLTPIATLRYNVGIVLPKSDIYAYQLTLLSLIFCLTFSILLTVVVYVITVNSLLPGSYSFIHDYLMYIPVFVMLSGVLETLESLVSRFVGFKKISLSRIQQSAISNAAKISFGILFKPTLISLLISHLAMVVVGVNKLRVGLEWRKILGCFKRKRLILIAKKYSDFPCLRLPSRLLLVLATNLPLIFFGYYYTPNETGQLGLALMCVALPISLIGNSVSQVYYTEIAKINNRDTVKIKKLTIAVLKKLSIVGLIPTIILFLSGKDIIRLTLGEEWVVAGVYVEYLSIMLYFQFISSPLVNVFNVVGTQYDFLKINIVRTMFIVLVFSLSVLMKLTSFQCILAYSTILSFHYVLTTLRVVRTLN
ncbi:lipopolysaccharide biosynthesis protein [Providencia manganoxydans]|uniref:lipopolysaccharide biosynthesis protein n=1 Tax=Providencia manganoxydans TaxID=2923283 RepID=UPI0034DCD667